jgi:hypothetical protein
MAAALLKINVPCSNLPDLVKKQLTCQNIMLFSIIQHLKNKWCLMQQFSFWHFLERARLVLLEAESFIRLHAFYQKSVLEKVKSTIKHA